MTNRAFSGIFPILQTPFNQDGSLDERSLRREVDFCLKAGVHGVVTPAWASEFFTLSDAERENVVSIVVERANGRVPVVAGVSAPSKETVLYHTRRAEELGADSVMAMPPFVRFYGQKGILDFYRALAESTKLPIIVQSSPMGVNLSPELLARLFDEVPTTWYVKEETQPIGPRMSALLREGGNKLAGVFGGWAAVWLVSELERGACGSMPAAHVCDIQVRIYEAFMSGDRSRAFELYRKLLPLMVLETQHMAAIPKSVLKKRGVIRESTWRDPGESPPDAIALEQVYHLLEELGPMLVRMDH